MIKTGIGYDVHKLASNSKLILGGVEIPYEFGSVGHSDGDVLIHAIVDSILGASSLGDIGQLFSSSDNKWKNANSMIFLQLTVEKVQLAGFKINHIDSVIILQEPNLSAYINKMRSNISDIIKLQNPNFLSMITHSCV